MGMFDKDPKYQELKAIRDSGYKGWLDQNNKKVDLADWKKSQGWDDPNKWTGDASKSSLFGSKKK